MSYYTQNERQLDKILRKFAQESLKPSETHLEEAKRIQQKLIMSLQQYGNPYKVDRLIISGSFGKATNLYPFDIDMVAFVNNVEPPFDKVLIEWGRHLVSSKMFDKVEISAPYMIKLKSGKYYIQLLPGTNFSLTLDASSGSRLIEQQVNALKKISRETNPSNSSFSSSLAEGQVEFIKQQSDFVHQLIRLCKYWKSEIKLESKTGHKINGFSLAVELIAVYVGKNFAGETIVAAFRQFLNEIKNFEKISVAFEMPYEYRVAIGSIPTFPDPKIVDPANPWNNLATEANFPRGDRDLLKDHAHITLTQLENLISTIPSGCTEDYMKEKLFTFS